MGNKSRGRHRFAQQGGPAPGAPDDEEQSRWVGLMERANTRGGLRHLVGALLADRDKQLAEPDEAITDDAPVTVSEPRGLREPTQYELAILSGLSRKQVYGGTVEPWRIDARRRRNRAARKARRKANHR